MTALMTAACFKPWCPYAFVTAYSLDGLNLLNTGVSIEDPDSWCRVSRCNFYVTQKKLDGFCDMVECHWQEFQREEVRKRL